MLLCGLWNITRCSAFVLFALKCYTDNKSPPHPFFVKAFNLTKMFHFRFYSATQFFIIILLINLTDRTVSHSCAHAFLGYVNRYFSRFKKGPSHYFPLYEYSHYIFLIVFCQVLLTLSTFFNFAVSTLKRLFAGVYHFFLHSTAVVGIISKRF